jgi:hypothetical protein
MPIVQAFEVIQYTGSNKEEVLAAINANGEGYVDNGVNLYNQWLITDSSGSTLLPVPDDSYVIYTPGMAGMITARPPAEYAAMYTQLPS